MRKVAWPNRPEVVRYSIIVTATVTAAATGTFTNTVQIATDTPETRYDDNWDDDPTDVEVADVAICMNLATPKLEWGLEAAEFDVLPDVVGAHIQKSLQLVDVIIQNGHQTTGAAVFKIGQFQVLHVAIGVNSQFVLQILGQIAPFQRVGILK